MLYDVTVSRAVQNQLVHLYHYISKENSREAAKKYLKEIIDYLDSFKRFPMRGDKRDDLKKGLRLTNYKGRLVIAFRVEKENKKVLIAGVFYAGQDVETLLKH